MTLSSCWVVTEGLAGLNNQAIGLAQALGVPYILKKVPKPNGFWQLLAPRTYDFTPPWPELLISCGRQSVDASIFVKRASKGETFTVHIQDPLVDPKQFDVVVAPAHDKVQGENVFVSRGAIHQVTKEKLARGAKDFDALLGGLPRPLISVLVGGKNKHQDFSPASIKDFAAKLVAAQKTSGGSIAMTTSRRTGAKNEVVLRQELAGLPCYIWDGKGANPFFGLLGLADALVVTSDSISMISEASSTGKPLYIYELPHCGRRHKELCESFIAAGVARRFGGKIEQWGYEPLNETAKAAEFIREHWEANHLCRH